MGKASQHSPVGRDSGEAREGLGEPSQAEEKQGRSTCTERQGVGAHPDSALSPGVRARSPV